MALFKLLFHTFIRLIHRNSDILTPKVVKFLFFLAKQKEKPQMSIPKIINITDNLLANSITNNGSVEALYHLAFEIYFPRHIDDGDSDEPQHTAKELNTTKEVVLSMLLKFIGHFKVSGTLKESREFFLTNPCCCVSKFRSSK